MNLTYKKINWPKMLDKILYNIQLETIDVLCSEEELMIELLKK